MHSGMLPPLAPQQAGSVTVRSGVPTAEGSFSPELPGRSEV
jgi:hypothetical protein